MATRLYYVAGSAPPISPVFDAGWNSTVGAVRRLLDAKAAATEQSTVDIAATGPSYTCQVQLISPPLAAQTISGTVSVVTRGRENTSNANINKRARAVRVVSADGLTVRGTLAAWAATASTTELSATTLQGQQHALNVALTAVAAQAGDRLVVEVGFGVGTSGTTPQATMEWGGSGTDHANSNSDITGTVPWVEFSQDLLWQTGTPSAVTLTPATLTMSAPPVSPVPRAVNRTLTPAGFTLTAAAVAATPLPVTVTLTPADIEVTAVPVGPAAQPMTVQVMPAEFRLDPVPVGAAPAPVVAAAHSVAARQAVHAVTAETAAGRVTWSASPASVRRTT